MAHAIVQQGQEGGFAVTFFNNEGKPTLFVETRFGKVAKLLKEKFEQTAPIVEVQQEEVVAAN